MISLSCAQRSGVHAVIAAALQTGITILAFSEQSATAPLWVWISILIVTPIAIILGGRAKDLGGQTVASETRLSLP